MENGAKRGRNKRGREEKTGPTKAKTSRSSHSHDHGRNPRNRRRFLTFG